MSTFVFFVSVFLAALAGWFVGLAVGWMRGTKWSTTSSHAVGVAVGREQATREERARVLALFHEPPDVRVMLTGPEVMVASTEICSQLANARIASLARLVDAGAHAKGKPLQGTLHRLTNDPGLWRCTHDLTIVRDGERLVCSWCGGLPCNHCAAVRADESGVNARGGVA